MNAAGLPRLGASTWARAVCAALLFAVGIAIVAEIRAQLESRPVSNAATPYSLSLSNRAPNWASPLPQTKITVVRGGLNVQGTRSAFAYQLVSWPIEVEAGASYRLSFEADVTVGRMGVGVLDMETYRWIVDHPIFERSDSFAFTPMHSKIQVVLHNNNGIEAESAAILRKLIVTRER